jgi:uncharacterized protein (DUF1800 family)
MARRPFSSAPIWAILMFMACGTLAAFTCPASGQTLFITTMTPTPGITDSLGYGSATLVLAADQKSATLHFSYSNLTTPEVSEHIHAAVDKSIIFDIDKPAPPSPAIQPLPDGSWLWVFDTSASAPFTVAQIVNFIQTGQTYINVHSSKYPNGEIKGTFILATGSQTFTPPPAPPVITINPPTTYDASRFLAQAEFGGTIEEITALSNPNASNATTALNDWLTQQFASQLPIAPDYSASTAPTSNTFSPSSIYKTIFDRVTTPQAPNAYADSLSTDRVVEAWWGNALSGNDQLRQRVATALSEIFVVSEIDSNISNNVPGLATYHDMLADDAFTNFRQILGDVTLHPVMGDYLNMMGNAYSTAHLPNENYAREIMQLFSVGLYQIFPDGTLQLDVTGSPIPTYSQAQISSMAHVYTGWNRNGTPLVIPTLPAPTPPATVPVVVNFNSYWQKPMVVTASQHSPKAKQLLSYMGAKLWTGGATTQPTDPVTIPANATQTAATATAELNFTLDNIFNHPNTGPFVCKQLIQRLVTSNPSPGYVYRVAKAFADDGTSAHVRGNMKAVITAILTDYEARSPAIIATDQAEGHMREPLIRIADILRPLHAFSNIGKWKIGSTNNALNQTIYRSPTVFNFFPPDFSQPGPLQSAGDASPEFAIIYQTTISNAQNMIYTGIYSPNYAVKPVTGTGWRGDNYGSDVYLPLAANPSSSQSTSLLGTNSPAASLQNVDDPTITAHGGVELGMKFTSDVAGTISGVRFWKGSQNTGVHTGELWSAAGAKLAAATFANESASGWQQVNFSAPVTITAKTTYIVSYHTTSSFIAYGPQALASSIDNAPLHAPSSSASGGNCVYNYDTTPGTSSFPNVSNGQSPSYWVDVVFNYTGATTSSLLSATAAPISGLQNVYDSGISAHGGVELGLKFTSDVAGTINGVRFWKGAQNTGVHTGELWNAAGTKLATATFANETASGWQQVNFSAGVAITANTTYLVSYHTTSPFIAYGPQALTSSIDNAPLHAPSSNVSGGNGVYNYDPTPGIFSFPTLSNGQAPSYWVDVLFSSSSVPGLVGLAQSGGTGAMLDQAGLLLTSAPLDPSVKTIVQNYISSNVNATDYLGQVKAGLYLIATSAQCAAEK